jgi:hypothetical protein
MRLNPLGRGKKFKPAESPSPSLRSARLNPLGRGKKFKPCRYNLLGLSMVRMNFRFTISETWKLVISAEALLVKLLRFMGLGAISGE